MGNNFLCSGLVFCYIKKVNPPMARLDKYQRQSLPGMYMTVMLERLNGTDSAEVHQVLALWSCTGVSSG